MNKDRLASILVPCVVLERVCICTNGSSLGERILPSLPYVSVYSFVRKCRATAPILCLCQCSLVVADFDYVVCCALCFCYFICDRARTFPLYFFLSGLNAPSWPAWGEVDRRGKDQRGTPLPPKRFLKKYQLFVHIRFYFCCLCSFI